jgi:hypothetical protein
MRASVSFLGEVSSLRERPLRELLRSADELAAQPEVSEARAGVTAHKGHISVIDREYILHAYFLRQHVEFELYGPPPRETGRLPRPLRDGGGLAGAMSVDSLKEVLRMLDRGESPVQFLEENADILNSDRDSTF